MRECIICGSREHVASKGGVQLCLRCAGALHRALGEKLRPPERPEAAPGETAGGK